MQSGKRNGSEPPAAHGTTLPSNLQGLFEVRYKGDTLDGDATIRLMEAINELKKTAESKKG